MERSILIADQTGGRPVSVRDARERDMETGRDRVIQLVSPVARPAGDLVECRSSLTAADPPQKVSGIYPAVAGDPGGYVTSVWIRGDDVVADNFGDCRCWWSVVYDGATTTFTVYAEEQGVTPVASGSRSGRGGTIYLSPINDWKVSGGVTIASNVVTENGEENTLIFPEWHMMRVLLGDSGGRFGISLVVNGFSTFESAHITPLVLTSAGDLLARLETKQFIRGGVDITNEYNNLMLPVQWWEAQGAEAIAVHVTGIAGGGSITPYMLRG